MEKMDVGISIVKVLREIMSSIKQSVKEQFEEMDLTGSQGMLIGTLAHHGPMKIGELSERVGLSNSTVSGIVDRLEKKNLVERRRSQKDRRVVVVEVTSALKENSKDHYSTIDRKIQSILEEATPEEVDKILEGFHILKELMDKENNKTK